MDEAKETDLVEHDPDLGLENATRAAYEAWSEALGGMVPTGFSVPYALPKFDQLTTHVRQAFEAAVLEVVAHVTEPVSDAESAASDKEPPAGGDGTDPDTVTE
jgi:hypothetical protein